MLSRLHSGFGCCPVPRPTVGSSKACDSVSHKILLEQLWKRRLLEQAGRCMENWLRGQAQRVVISGTVWLEASNDQCTPGVNTGSSLL